MSKRKSPSRERGEFQLEHHLIITTTGLNTPRFRARCSCGWGDNLLRSSAMSAEAEWREHAEAGK